MALSEIRPPLGQESPLEQTKIALMERLSDEPELEPELSESLYTLFARIAGCWIRFRCHGPEAQAASVFLLDYFSRFGATRLETETQSREFGLTFDLTFPGGPDFDAAHPMWNEDEYRHRHRRLSNGQVWLLHRDLVAFATEPDRVKAFLPCPSARVTDGIDNLLGYFLPKLLLTRPVLTLHASTVVKDGGAYVFYGASGVGKSTLARFCHERFGLSIMGGDQIHLGLDPKTGALMAYPAATTVADYPRHHPGLLVEPRPVRGLVHLVQLKRFHFRVLSPIEGLRHFLRELNYQKEFGNPEKLLSVAQSLFKAYAGRPIEMSYPKGEDFWPQLTQVLKENAYVSTPVSATEA